MAAATRTAVSVRGKAVSARVLVRITVCQCRIGSLVRVAMAIMAATARMAISVRVFVPIATGVLAECVRMALSVRVHMHMRVPFVHVARRGGRRLSAAVRRHTRTLLVAMLKHMRILVRLATGTLSSGEQETHAGAER